MNNYLALLVKGVSSYPYTHANINIFCNLPGVKLIPKYEFLKISEIGDSGLLYFSLKHTEIIMKHGI